METDPNYENLHLVDIENALKEKNPKLYNLLPQFVINYLKKIVHQTEINEILIKHKDKSGLEFINHSLNEMAVKTQSIGLQNVPQTGGAIIVSNHPLGGLDGVAIIQEVGKVRNDIHIMVNDILMQIKNFNPIFIPINKHGKNARKNLSYIDSLYSSDKCIILFPAGLVSRRQENKIIKDLEWKKSFVSQCIKHKNNIIPAYAEGLNSKKFYNIAFWRKKLGIKANIEMLFLADEMFKQKGNTINFIFGNAIAWEAFNNSATPLQWAQQVKDHVYELKDQSDKKFAPVIK
jgi:1-acyl-sn-glycerol-3-phosphate acyltransferase